jgi:cytosine deaminase
MPRRKVNYFEVKKHIIELIRKKGGWVNTHTHLDRAYTLTAKNFPLYESPISVKWGLVDEMKRRSSVEDIRDRMALAIENMLEQGVTALGSFIDVDEIIRDKSIKAAIKIREKYKKDIKIIFMNQVLKGVLEPAAREWFDIGAQFVDIIGGLPGKDKGKEDKHLDVLFTTAKKMKKMVHVHVDQLNLQEEKETELLVKKTLEHGMRGKAVGIHGISIGAHPLTYRQKLYRSMKKAGVMMISCPTAWIDHRRTENLIPDHNAITPVDEMVPAGITVALGIDNICDIYLPFSDGDMWTELRLLSAAARFTDIDKLVEIATVNGRKILGL